MHIDDISSQRKHPFLCNRPRYADPTQNFVQPLLRSKRAPDFITYRDPEELKFKRRFVLAYMNSSQHKERTRTGIGSTEQVENAAQNEDGSLTSDMMPSTRLSLGSLQTFHAISLPAEICRSMRDRRKTLNRNEEPLSSSPSSYTQNGKYCLSDFVMQYFRY